ncbi:folylpolyglutamate synthase/dihydrofolate synthase family protein [Candidatus Cyanaurora vandensis]|uniref:bifunctional folylpolyglutamate synthase/dihydrofolate synthase n=1 Tax=Candidatus Cyanaurora vandensis TaxID=2714958 RepID=UPI00257C0E92|nr:folylpolyglutamate synthase/dihydrofolate synthase family protein [Candidatus Cyanaurora vandensis]
MPHYAQLLDNLQNSGIRLGLERMQGLMARLGQPQMRVPCVHVAGTNGKGSTCAFVSQIWQEAGYRIGRYTSPHLVDWRERITVNGRPIPAHDLDRVLTDIAPHATQADASQFEYLTAAAFLYFAELDLDGMVLEVGLGGRLDATNIVQPLVTAITSIGLDHCNLLGDTLEQIAREKAGIFKPGVPVISATLPATALGVIQTIAREKNAPLTVVPPATRHGTTYTAYGVTYTPSLPGAIQAQNSAVALGLVQELVAQGWRIPLIAQQRGLERAHWPGRYQQITAYGKTIFLDGAHNAEGAAALREFVTARGGPVSWIVGMLKTKDSTSVLGHLLRSGDEFFAVPVLDASGFDPGILVEQARVLVPDLALSAACPDIPTALAKVQHPVVLCGSLYLIGDFLASLGYTPEQLYSSAGASASSLTG